MSFLRRTIPTISALLMVGCNALPYVADPSISAADAGDYTLILSACDAAPGNGMDICRIVEGQPITQNWVMILPFDKKNVGGEVSVFYKGLEKDYAITGNTLTIPWKDFFGVPLWAKSMDGEALALVSAKFKDDAGIQQEVLLRGIAKLVVVDSKYTRLPIDSNLQSWQSECKIQYTAQGRSAISCK